MLIEHTLKRTGGTVVPMGETVYHFAPDSEGRHVAIVENEAHVERFLSITEGYREIPVEVTSVKSEVIDVPAPPKPKRKR